MSGICGGWLGGKNDLTDAQDRMYQRQIDRIRKEEASSVPSTKRKGRRPRTRAIAKADTADE